MSIALVIEILLVDSSFPYYLPTVEVNNIHFDDKANEYRPLLSSIARGFLNVVI